MFITGAKATSAEGSSTVQKLISAATTYLTHVAATFFTFAGAVTLLLTVSAAFPGNDMESFGLGWLYCTSLRDDRVREEKFPLYAPHTPEQRRRSEAAGAVDYAVKTV